MQKEESAVDSWLSPSFSVYSSNNVNDVAQQVIHENDSDNFEFVAFQKTADEAFFDHRRRNIAEDAAESLIPLRELMTRDGNRWNSGTAEDSTLLQKFMIGDEKRNIDTPPLPDMEDELDAVPTASYCFWTPKSPMSSPLASPIKCKKSNSTGSSSNSSSSKRWKFLSLLRRSKSDIKESLKSGGKNVPVIAEKKIPVSEKKTPAPVTAMEAFYLRKKEIIKRKAYLPYKEELIGFGIGFHATIGRVHV